MLDFEITPKHIDFFRFIIAKYNEKQIPKEGAWKDMDENQLWDKVVGQVMVVGGTAGHDRYKARPELIEKIKYSNLTKISNDDELLKIINFVLIKASIRYASKNLSKCVKSKSLLYNFNFLKKYDRGITQFITEIDSISGFNSEINKARIVTSSFKFFKNKSSRDFLMEIGVCRNTIALDSRLYDIFNHVDLKINKDDLNSSGAYEFYEYEIVNKICKPLGILPVKFDRILFRNHKSIMNEWS